MNIRDALIQQSPSLALQRAASNEIAVLDSHIREVEAELQSVRQALAAANEMVGTQAAELRTRTVQNQKQ